VSGWIKVAVSRLGMAADFDLMRVTAFRSSECVATGGSGKYQWRYQKKL